eukprot:g17453.t1
MTSPISDETLTAFMDGELSTEERREIEAALASDPALAARLEALDLPLDALKAGFDSLLTAAPAYPEDASSKALPARESSWRLPAMAASILAIGMLIGTLWSPWSNAPQANDWKMAIANYQVLYVPATLPGDEPDTDQALAQLQRLSEELGRDLSNASAVAGLSYRRAQMLGLNAEPLVQIAYLSEGNDPFAICITPVDEASYAPTTETLAGLAASHWVEDGFGYLVIGGTDLNTVSTIAADLQGRI